MQIGIMSDTHNKLTAVHQALEILRARKISLIVHCGDLTNERLLQQFYGFSLYLAFGNADFATGAISLAVKKLDREGLTGENLEFSLNARQFFVTHGHYPARLQHAIDSGRYDYILTGHTHTFRDERQGGCRVINPGALGGNKGNYSFAILDTELDLLERFPVGR
ncbi:MAG: metallophosphoesterase family protein [Anaerolineaceae bacterium]